MCSSWSDQDQLESESRSSLINLLTGQWALPASEARFWGSANINHITHGPIPGIDFNDSILDNK